MDAENWPTAADNVKRIQKIIFMDMWLGFIVVLIGSTGPFW